MFRINLLLWGDFFLCLLYYMKKFQKRLVYLEKSVFLRVKIGLKYQF